MKRCRPRCPLKCNLSVAVTSNHATARTRKDGCAPESRLAPDSPLEGAGFEPSVPLHILPVSGRAVFDQIVYPAAAASGGCRVFMNSIR